MTTNRIATLLAATALSGAVMAAPAHAGKVEDLEAQVQLMQQQMAALQQAIMDAKAESAAANEAAKADTAAAVAAVKTDVAAATKTASAAADAAKKGSSSAPSVKVSGKLYANISTGTSKTDGVKTDEKSGFELKRAYVTVEGKISDVWSANVTTDIQYVEGSNGTKGVTPYLKKAYLQGKFSDAFTVRIGEADLPWVPFAESLYGFRYVENTVADKQKVGTSAGWGVHAFGKMAGGMVNYAVSVVNTANDYKNPTKNQGVDFEGRLSVNPVKDITIGAGVTTGKLGKNNFSDTGENRTATRFNAIAAYTGNGANIGVEFYSAKNWNIAETSAEDKSEGFSAFAAYKIDKVTPFVRFDHVKPKKLTDDTKKDNYFNAGLAYSVTKGVDIAAVFKHGKVENTVASVDHNTTTNEFGVWTQVAF